MLTALTLLTLSAHAREPEPPPYAPMVTVQEATATATTWLESLTDGAFTLTVTAPERGLASYCRYYSSPPCPLSHKEDSLFIYQTSSDSTPAYLTVGFRGAISPETPLKEVQRQLQYVNLGNLPVSALTAEGWIISPSTPVSPVSSGIQVTGFDGHRIQIEVDADFFGVYGHASTPQCAPYPDQPSSPACVFRVDTAHRGHILIDLPIFTAPPT